MTIRKLYDNPWASVHEVVRPDLGITGYSYLHEKNRKGRTVAIMPFADTSKGRRYLVKSEVTPCWALVPILSAITGAYEGGSIVDDAVRELEEETGYMIDASDLIPLGTTYTSKCSDTVVSLFSADLTGLTPGEALGDGSRLESESSTLWIPAIDLSDIEDPQVSAMYVRLAARTAGKKWRVT